MTPGSAGSTPRAIAGKVSVTRLIQSNELAARHPIQNKVARKMFKTSAVLAEKEVLDGL